MLPRHKSRFKEKNHFWLRTSSKARNYSPTQTYNWPYASWWACNLQGWNPSPCQPGVLHRLLLDPIAVFYAQNYTIKIKLKKNPEINKQFQTYCWVEVQKLAAMNMIDPAPLPSCDRFTFQQNDAIVTSSKGIYRSSGQPNNLSYVYIVYSPIILGAVGFKFMLSKNY